MAAELIDLRAKITPETDAVLDAHALADGSDKCEIVRTVLHEWAEKQIMIARCIMGAIDGLTPITQDAMPSKRYRREPISRSLRLQIFERDGGKCTYCGGEVALSGQWHIDHVTPVSRGGLSEPSNLALACIPCNLKKAAGEPDRLKAA